jgi:hypothetical protein
MVEIPKIVSQRLQALVRPGDHPDPNQLGAFAERTLGKRERIQVLEHLFQCASCREIVSLSAIQPEIAVIVPANPGWLSWPGLRWVALGACVIVVSAVVTLRPKQEARQIATTITAERPVAETQIRAPNGAVGKKAAERVLDSEAKTAIEAEPTVSRQKAKTGNRNDAAAVARSAPIEMAYGRTTSPFAEVVPGRAKNALAESQGTQAEKAVGGPSAKKPMMAASVGVANIADSAPVPANLSPRWTLSSDGTLQRSLDSGGTWQTIPVSSQTVFRALAANGQDIWVGGAAGALFHSSDAGQHWTQVRPVLNGEALADDIIGVEFSDTLHGKLTTSSQETWMTADAGQTWQIQ